ncbi:hypothetical protein GF345_04200 [Candidatus Woesearchaeota archaeon]|nr:hypothetical protein [Candidatus Woesearchaeota archaeon]
MIIHLQQDMTGDPMRKKYLMMFALAIMVLSVFVIADSTDNPYAADSNEDLVKRFNSDDTGDLIKNPDYLSELERRATDDISVLNNNPDLMNAWLDVYGLKPGFDAKGILTIRSFNSAGGVVVTEGIYSTTFNIEDHPGASIMGDGSLVLPDATVIKAGNIKLDQDGDMIITNGAVLNANYEDKIILVNSSITVGGMTYHSEGEVIITTLPLGYTLIHGEDISEFDRDGVFKAKINGSVTYDAWGTKGIGWGPETTTYTLYDDKGLKMREYAVDSLTPFYEGEDMSKCQYDWACIADSDDAVLVNPLESPVSVTFFRPDGTKQGTAHFTDDGIRTEGNVMGSGADRRHVAGFVHHAPRGYLHIITKDGRHLYCQGDDCAMTGRENVEPYMDKSRKDEFSEYKKTHEKDYIVLHNTQLHGDPSTAKNTINYFANKNFAVQYVVDTDGKIYELTDSGASPGGIGTSKKFINNPDWYGKIKDLNSISIEFVSSATKDPTPEQIEAASELVSYLQKKHDIPTDNVVTHYELTIYNPDDPRLDPESPSYAPDTPGLARKQVGKGKCGVNIHDNVEDLLDPATEHAMPPDLSNIFGEDVASCVEEGSSS